MAPKMNPAEMIAALDREELAAQIAAKEAELEEKTKGIRAEIDALKILLKVVNARDGVEGSRRTWGSKKKETPLVGGVVAEPVADKTRSRIHTILTAGGPQSAGAIGRQIGMDGRAVIAWLRKDPYVMHNDKTGEFSIVKP